MGKCPNFRVISEIQRAKFGVFVTYIFGGKIWGSNKNFRGKFWGQDPRPPSMEVPPWEQSLKTEKDCLEYLSKLNAPKLSDSDRSICESKLTLNEHFHP